MSRSSRAAWAPARPWRRAISSPQRPLHAGRDPLRRRRGLPAAAGPAPARALAAARDWPAVAGLGFAFYGVFFVLYNVALGFTTVARGTLALSTLPLMTMVAGGVLGIEPLSRRKTAGVAVAMLGVAVALASGLRGAPPGAWRGDLIMAAATLCMALYNVFSRPFMQRSSALGFLASRHGGRRRGARAHQPGHGWCVAALPGSVRATGSRPSILRPAAGRSRFSCGCMRCSTRAPRASPTP